MIGRAQAGIENEVELGTLGRRLLQRTGRLPAEQQLERPHARIALVFAHEGAVIQGLIHVDDMGQDRSICK